MCRSIQKYKHNKLINNSVKHSTGDTFAQKCRRSTETINPRFAVAAERLDLVVGLPVVAAIFFAATDKQDLRSDHGHRMMYSIYKRKYESCSKAINAILLF